MILFDRHVEKNGGGSVHESMRASNCTFFGYSIYKPTWNRIRTARAQKKSICIDAHSPVDDDWLSKIRSIENKSIILLRIRNPANHYKSFYKWGVPRKFEFVSWFPNDLQTNILLHSHRAVLAQRNKTLPVVTEQECDRLLREVQKVDYLYTTENMDCAWKKLRSVTHLALPSFHISERPRFKQAPILPTHDIVSNLSKQKARCDWKLYALASQSRMNCKNVSSFH